MTTDGLDRLLAGEHAAVYGYGTAGAMLVKLGAPGIVVSTVRSAYDAHRESRDALAEAIVAQGGTPPETLPVYAAASLASPAAVLNFLAGIEDRLCQTAAIAVSATASRDRLLAAGVLNAAAVRAVQLRLLAGAKPATAVTPLPGLPGR